MASLRPAGRIGTCWALCSRSRPSRWPLPTSPRAETNSFANIELGGIMERKASAVWQGNLKGGKGTISTASGALSNTQYSFSTRFENGVGTNPEELIAAAHAGCFSMALSAELGKAGITPESIHTTATITLDKTDAGWTITESHLDVTARIPDVDPAKFTAAANAAKAGCPISRLLKANVTMDAKLAT